MPMYSFQEGSKTIPLVKEGGNGYALTGDRYLPPCASHMLLFQEWDMSTPSLLLLVGYAHT